MTTPNETNSQVPASPEGPAVDGTTSLTLGLDVQPASGSDLKRLGPYLIEAEIGRGAMGTVYRAEHSRLKRKVALKVVPPELTISRKRLKRFQREMEAVGRLDHPNLVRATDAGDEGGIHYLVMELIDGVDLERRLAALGAFPLGSGCEVARQTALGLEHIRQHGLVHRDIKPSNLLLTNDGIVKILDLGIAMLRHDDGDSSVTTLGALMGTPDFIAPEQVRHAGAVDIRADIYSLGCTLYMLIAGRPPFGGPDHSTNIAKMIAHTNAEAPRLDEVDPRVPAPLADVVARMMAKSPNDRYQSPQEVVDALQPWADATELTHVLGSIGSANLPTPVTPGLSGGDPGRPKSARSHAVRGVPSATTSRTTKYTVIASTVVVASLLAYAAVFSGDPDDTSSVASRRDHGSLQATAHVTTTATSTADTLESTREPVAPSGGLLTPPSPELTQVAEDTAVIREHTADLAATNRQIDHHTQRIAESMDQLREAFVLATRTGGVIAQPESVAELYHNARTYESLGNPQLSRESYLQLFARGADYVDVHEHFQQQLRLQEGPAGARAAYRDLPGNNETAVRAYAVALLSDLPERERQLTELLERHPDFAPAVYELSRCWSRVLIGEQTLVDKANEKRTLERFITLAQQGEYLSHFLETSVASEKMIDAEQRLAALESFDPSVVEHPVELSFSRFSRGWNMTVQVKETAREIFYRLDSDPELKSTGFTEHVDLKTQAARPITLLSLPASTSACQVEVAYTDVRGVRRGPFSIAFNPEDQLLIDAKRELGYRQQSWMMFGNGRHRDQLYFNFLARYRDVIRTVRFAVDHDAPTTEFQLPDVESGEGGTATVPVPAESQFAVVQITFADGTQSDVVRVER